MGKFLPFQAVLSFLMVAYRFGLMSIPVSSAERVFSHLHGWILQGLRREASSVRATLVPLVSMWAGTDPCTEINRNMGEHSD